MSLERQEFRELPADHSLGDKGERAASLVNYEPNSEDHADCCPYCRRPLEILFVKFRIRGTAIIASCANCGIAQADEWRAAESKALDKVKALARKSWSLWQGSASMVSFNRRFRYVPTFLLGALITAAALRHGVHVYGGISPEEIRAGALMAIPAVALAIIFSRRKRQR
jgi:hypothetical protein